MAISEFSAPVSSRLPFSARLAFDVALTLESSGFSLDEVLDQHGVSKDEFITLSKNQLFLKYVKEYREEVRTKGLTFKFKARAQAEELLNTSWRMIHDPSVAPSVKADLIKSTVKWAGLEPKEAGPASDGGGGVRILINMGNSTGATPLVVEHMEQPAYAETVPVTRSEE